MSKIIKTYKYRIYPNKQQKDFINKTLGCCRFVYNFCRGQQKKQEDLWFTVNEMVQQGYFIKNNFKSKYFNVTESKKWIPELKQQFAWLKEVDSIALQASIENLGDAYEKYYAKKGGKPKFKSKKNPVQSYTTKCINHNIEYLGKYIKLPKLENVKTKNKCTPEGKIKTATISRTNTGKYYVSLTCELLEIKPYPKTKATIGMDLGISSFAAFSNGEKEENPTFLEKELKKLSLLQKRLARKTIGSQNYKKLSLRIAKVHESIKNKRNDFLQKLSTNLIKQYDILCMEDLDVKGMIKQGDKVRDRHLSDVSWQEFVRQLKYKAAWYGKSISQVDRYFPSSQICSCCGYQDGKKEISIRVWKCSKCNTILDRDVNASNNILHEGLRLLGMES